ncbi:hypothetical protein CA11_33420 [Gimesia maris]|uniref:DUF1559 family PulG-like putative transporter n=1 Tax=Gimesia maris TaxID=122 RepID=UPI00118B55EC|nr:DUF1559 domain-containing protein [Gimesia maris]QDU15516.1 hypothetical protein CA11_33420 [Gimesia maris]
MVVTTRSGIGGISCNSRDILSNANDTYRINGADADDLFSSMHVGGCHFVFADGRIKFLFENINGDTYTGLALIMVVKYWVSIKRCPGVVEVTKNPVDGSFKFALLK